MVKVIHLVGGQGSGKTQIAVALSELYKARGLKCEGADSARSEFLKDRQEALFLWPGADVIFLEHLPGEEFDVGKGDQVIRVWS